MEIKEGKLLIKIKGGKHWKKRHVKIDNKDISISKEFQLDSSMNNKNCKVFFDNGKIVDIEIDGKKITKEENKNKVKKIPKCENKSNLRVPNDTCLILQNAKIDIDNFHLKLNKFTIFNNNDEAKIKEQNISETFFNRNWDYYKLKIEEYQHSIQKFNPKIIKLETSYRLVIGSEQSIYESSLRLHHIYGIPYIPASAIKGVLRSYIIIEKFDSKEEKALEDKDFKKVFGSQEQEGRVIFFDAFPTSKPKLKVDIMNPHYGHYYNDGKAPTDDKNPIPINFLTVEETEFKFFIASKDSLESFKIKDKSIGEWLKEALHNHGIGAKNAVGYGYFNEL